MDLLQSSVQTHFEKQSFLTNFWKVVLIVINDQRPSVLFMHSIASHTYFITKAVLSSFIHDYTSVYVGLSLQPDPASFNALIPLMVLCLLPPADRINNLGD